VGKDLEVTNAVGFVRFQWQRVESVEQPDGSLKRFVEVGCCLLKHVLKPVLTATGCSA